MEWENRTDIFLYEGPGSWTARSIALYLLLALRRLKGINAHHFPCSGNPDLHGRADLRLLVDFAEDLSPHAEWLPKRRRAYWASDSHMSEACKQFRLAKAQKFDVVWYAVRAHAEEFEQAMGWNGDSHYWMKARWLPYAADPTLWKPAERKEKRYALGWVGHAGSYLSRIALLSILLDEFGEQFHYCYKPTFEEGAVEWMQPCWFFVNHCGGDSTNMRTFEAMAMGAVLLQPQTSDLSALGFKDGVNLVTYRDADEAIAKVREYLGRPEDMLRIGTEARQTILAGHTWVHRAAVIAAEAGWKRDDPRRTSQRDRVQEVVS